MMKLQLNRIIVPLVLVVGCTTMCTTIQAQATEPQTFYGESSLPRYAAIERLTATLKINIGSDWHAIYIGYNISRINMAQTHSYRLLTFVCGSRNCR